MIKPVTSITVIQKPVQKKKQGNRKPASSLIHLDSVMYGVLAVGQGYLKHEYGSWVFHDQMPRASGCFHTIDDARNARLSAIDLWKNELDKHSKQGMPTQGHTCWTVDELIENFNEITKRLTQKIDVASGSVIVKLQPVIVDQPYTFADGGLECPVKKSTDPFAVFGGLDGYNV